MLRIASLFFGLWMTACASPRLETPTYVQNPTPADAYLASYERMDLDGLGPWLAKDCTFSDPTTAEIGGESLTFRGSQAILAGIQTSIQGLQDVRIRYRDRFYAGGLVVANGTLHYVLPGASIGVGYRDVTFDVQVVTVLQWQNGKVQSHTDYTDLSGWLAAVQAAAPQR